MKNKILTIFLLLFLPFVLLLTTVQILSCVNDYQIRRGLKEYQPVINYILEYKKGNGIYPDNVGNIKIKSKKFPYSKYETHKNKQDFIFLVGDFEYNPELPLSGTYRYCSNINLEDCNPTVKDRFVEHYAEGNWVVTYYTD